MRADPVFETGNLAHRTRQAHWNSAEPTKRAAMVQQRGTAPSASFIIPSTSSMATMCRPCYPGDMMHLSIEALHPLHIGVGEEPEAPESYPTGV